MKKLTKYFKQIDFFGSAPELLIHNSSTFKTNVGAIFTMLSLGIICYYLVRSIAKLLDTTSPQVDTLEFFDMAKLKLEISGSTVLPAITVSEPVNGFLLTVDEIQSLATIKGELRRYRYDYVANKVNYFSTFIDIVDCYKLKNTKPYTWMYSDVISGTKGKSLCFDLPTDSEWEIFGDRLYGDMNVLRLSMFPCSSSNCIPPDKVANHMFYLIKHQQYVQFSDYKDPIKKLSVLRENLNINPAAGTAIFNFYNRVNVYDTVSSLVDSNFVGTYLNPVKEEVNSYFRNSSQTKCTEAEITNMSCLAYMSLELRSSGFEVTYTRNYPDILNSFSDVGGFKELVVICVTILYSWVNDWLKGNYIIEEIMPLDSIKQLIKESIRLEESLEDKGGMVSAGDHNSPPPGGLPDKTIQTFMSTNLESVGQQTTNAWKLGHQKDQPSAGNESFKKVMPKNRESSHRLAEIPSNSTQMQIVVPITTTAENGSSNDQENPQLKQAPMDHNVARKKEFGYERLQRCVGNIKTIQSVAQAGRKKTEQKANPLIKLAAAFLNKEYSECIYFEEIKSMVEDLSNITLMIREINSWRAIKEILFLPHHFKLMPLVEIELEARRKKQATNVENTLKFPASTSSKGVFCGGNSMEAVIEGEDLPSIVAQSIEMKEALETLTEMVNADSKGEAPADYADWHRMLDRFYYKNLPQFAVNAMNLMKSDSLKTNQTNTRSKPPLKILKHIKNPSSQFSQKSSVQVDPLDEGSRLEMRASRDKKNLDAVKQRDLKGSKASSEAKQSSQDDWQLEGPADQRQREAFPAPAEEGQVEQ